MNRSIKTLWILLVTGLLCSGAVLWVVFSFPYSTLKPLADHLAKDGDLQSFSLTVYRQVDLPLEIAGGVLLALGGSMLLRKKQSLSLLEWLCALNRRTWRKLTRDAASFWADLRAFTGVKETLLTLGALAILALAARVFYLDKPFQHDEAYTFQVFALQPFRYLVADYHLPNNHVLHSILVRISFLLFGKEPWAVRLPALVSGVLLAPMGYLYGRTQYSRAVGWIAGGLIAAMPVLVDYSTDARGYTLVALLTLVVFTLALYLRSHDNLFAWLLFVLCSAAGMYTVPTMLLSLGIVYLWWLLSGLWNDLPADYGPLWKWIVRLCASGLWIVLLSAILYAPIMLKSGAGSVLSNRFVRPLSWTDFRVLAPLRLGQAWAEWTANVPVWLVYAGVLGLALGPVFHKRLTKTRIPFIAAAVVWLSFYLLARRPEPWSKITIFLIPLVLVWAAAGLTGLYHALIHHPLPRPFWLGIGSAFWIVLLTASLLRAYRDNPGFRAPMGTVEGVAVQLKPLLQPGDIVVVIPPDDAPTWYYFNLHDIPGQYIYNIKSHPFTRAYILLKKGETIQEAILGRGPDYGFFDLATTKALYQTGDTTVYEIYPDEERLRKAYGLDK